MLAVVTSADRGTTIESVLEKTAYIYREAQRHGIVRGRSIDCLLAASAYAACREMMIPKSPKEITEASNVSTKTLSKSYRLLIRELDLKVPRYLLGQYALKMASTACVC
jgi:transcription initiation factor TFIIB